MEDVTLERGVRFQLSDGTTLVSDHYYPPGNGQQPTLLMHQPYGRDIASTVVYAHPAWFARHGYNVVIQDVRGRGGSEGFFYPFRHEGHDGAETMRMAANASGIERSYRNVWLLPIRVRHNYSAAAERPEGLECIAPAMTACDLFAGWFYHNGALRLSSSLGWGLPDAQGRCAPSWAARSERAPGNRLAECEVTGNALALWRASGNRRSWVAIIRPRLVCAHRARRILVRNGCEREAHCIEVPALHISGWYDTYLEGSIRGFDLLRRNAGAQHARQNQYLVAGPWIHIPWSDRAGDGSFGPEALFDTDSLLLRWFDHWLKDAGTLTDEPRVRHFVLGSNTWHEADDWQGKSEVTLFLHSRGRAQSLKGDGILTGLIPSQTEQPDLFVYDPEVPVASPGGPQSLPGLFDQTAIEAGNNVLVYTSEPLTEPVHIFGAPRVALYAATSAPSADLTAKLVRVLPSGRAEFISIGIARSSFLFGSKYKADAIHRWEFHLEPTSCMFSAGERLRLEIAGCAFPLYDRNPSTDTPPREMTPFNWSRSTHIVHHDSEHLSVLPSCNRMSTIPESFFAT